jgi:hypothetical protein
VDHRPPASRITAPSSSRKGEKKLSAVLSSEGRLAIERFQREEAEDLRLRTMARIGELYMAQQGPQSQSQINLDGLDDQNDEDRLDQDNTESRSNENDDDLVHEDALPGEFVDDFTVVDDYLKIGKFQMDIKDSSPPGVNSNVEHDVGNQDTFSGVDPRVQYGDSTRREYVHSSDARPNPSFDSKRPTRASLNADSIRASRNDAVTSVTAIPSTDSIRASRNDAVTSVTAIPSTVLRKNVKVQTPLARLKHCRDTSWPLPGPTCTHKGIRQDGWTTQVRYEREEEE